MGRWLLKKTGLLGGYAELNDRYDDEKGTATHIRLSVDEYDKLKREIAVADAGKRDAEEKARKQINKAIISAEEGIEKAKKESEGKLESIKKKYSAEIRELRKQVEHEKKLNENLLRVATERANKARKIDKHEKGYLALSWQPFQYKRTIKKGKNTIVERHELYKITFQTPWDCSFPEEQVDRIVKKNLKSSELIVTNGQEIHWFNENLDLDTAIDTVQNQKQENDEIHDMILTRQYRADVRLGLWEVTFITNVEPTVNEKHRTKYV